MLLFPSPNWYAGKLTKSKTSEARQNSQLARDGSCQLISVYKTVEEINCKTAPNSIIVSNSKLERWHTYQDEND